MKYNFSIIKISDDLSSSDSLISSQIAGRYFYEYHVLGLTYSHDLGDTYTIYFNINNDTLIEDINYFNGCILTNIDIILSGTDKIKPGINYYINESLSRKIGNTDKSLIINKSDIVDREYDEDKYYIDPSYYLLKNNIKDLTFNENTLKSFYSNFCKFILEYTSIVPEEFNFGNNQIYFTVLEYYKNMQNDPAVQLMNLVLNSNYSISSNVSKSCGCGNNTTNNLTDGYLCSTSCLDIYKNSMFTFLKQMLSDINFYKDWMYIKISEDKYIPNENLINCLILFINEFEKLELDLSNKTNNLSIECPNISNDSKCKYNILNNYLRVLEWVKNDELIQNTNKIKIYGGQFAELLPQLQF